MRLHMKEHFELITRPQEPKNTQESTVIGTNDQNETSDDWIFSSD